MFQYGPDCIVVLYIFNMDKSVLVTRETFYKLGDCISKIFAAKKKEFRILLFLEGPSPLKSGGRLERF